MGQVFLCFFDVSSTIKDAIKDSITNGLYVETLNEDHKLRNEAIIMYNGLKEQMITPIININPGSEFFDARI